MSRRDLRRDFALMAGLVRQHGLTHDIADRENMRDVGSHLLIDVDETPGTHLDARRVCIDGIAIGRSAHGNQHPIK